MWYNLRMQFTKTAGHETQKRLFLRVVETGRLAHAYAFVGEAGIGKTTFALELARLLGADPVLDVILIDSEEGVSIDETRSLRSRLTLSPAGKSKVAVIRADNLTEEAAASILKVLEEPPARSVIFLIAINYYSLLPTIASRVQKVAFSRSSDEEVGTIFANQEVVRLASGRIGRAYRLSQDQEFLAFVRDCETSYEILAEGRLVERFLTAGKIAAHEPAQISFFIRYCMDRLSRLDGKISLLGHKLYAALADLDGNVNVKLAVDNLFLP